MRGAIAATLLLAGCATATPPAGPAALRSIALRNAGFEEVPAASSRCAASWACSMHADPDSFRFFHDVAAPAAGARSLCIERVRKEPWAVATQVVRDPSLAGQRVRFTALMRVESVEGPGAGPWALAHGPHGTLAHRQNLVGRTDGWQPLSVELAVPASTQALEVGATLEGGGRVCFDEARLDVLAPAGEAAK